MNPEDAPHRRALRRCLAPCLGLLVAACGSTDRDGAILVRDSLGITIVESRGEGDGWSPDAEWIAEAEPALQIGLLDGPPEYLLSSVLGAVRLDDGTIAVADAAGRVIRVYDADGRHVVSFDGRVEGPGAFFQASGLTAVGPDSLLVADANARRLAIFHARDGFVRYVAIPPELGFFRLIGTLAPDFVAGWSRTPTLRQPGSVGRDSAEVVLIRLDGTGVERLGRFPQAAYGYAPGLEPASIAAASTDGLWFGDGDAFEIRRLGTSGDVRLIARYAWTPEPVSEAELARIEEQYAASAAGTPRPSVPDHHPPYARALADDDGNLWIVSVQTGFTWRVFAPDGRLRGEVRMPSGFVPFHIGRDFVLVRHWDEFQVEYLRLHRIHKGTR